MALNHFLINMGAHMEGLTDEQIATVDAAVPDVRRLVDPVVANQTFIQQFGDEFARDWPTIAPAVQIVVDVIAKKQQASKESRS